MAPSNDMPYNLRAPSLVVCMRQPVPLIVPVCLLLVMECACTVIGNASILTKSGSYVVALLFVGLF
jgi:hypothetical protein